MALVLADRVKETTVTTGTGTVTLAGAATGFQSFAVVGNGNTTYYTIAGQGTAEWEVGIGTYTSAGTTLARTTVLASSNAGSLVAFSAGTKDVFVTYPAGRSIYADGTTLTATNSSVLPIASGGSGQTTAQLAMNAFAAAVTSGSYLRGNGTNVVMSTIQAADVPTLNQNTSGNAATATGLTSSNYISAAGSSGNANTDFQNTAAYTYRYQGDAASVTNGPGGSWWFYEDMRHSNASNYWGTQIAWGWEDNANKLATRNVTGGTFGAWVYYINSSNYTSYVTPTAVSDQTNSSTGYFDLPAGTTAQRPGSPNVGMVRYNTTLARYEGYTAAGWQILYAYTTYPVSYLIIAGGGCGGGQNGAGGGAGGMLEGTSTLTPGTVYNVVVGAGGISASGANSTALSLTAIGGGQGNGTPGGSGAGAGNGGSAGTGTAGQGNPGGSFSGSGGIPVGGGGGKGAAGGNPPSGSNGGNGGAGAASTITGTSVTYAGGGGGGVNPGTGGTGGSGGGGPGSSAASSPTPGTANTGGGGGGGNNNRAGTGGSGIVIFSVPTIFYSGTTTGSPTITTSGSNTIISFLSGSGSYTA